MVSVCSEAHRISRLEHELIVSHGETQFALKHGDELLNLAPVGLSSNIRSKPGSGGHNEPASSFRSGMLMQFLNPKGLVYGLTSMSLFITPHYTGSWLSAFSFLLAGAALMAVSCWAAFGSLIQEAFSKQTRLINGVMALMLVYSALSVLRDL